MKKFSTGTKGRKLEHADICKTTIVEFAVHRFGADTLAREYIEEVDPDNNAEAWAKWQEPALASLDFQKWLGEEIKTPSTKPAIATGPGLIESESPGKELEQAREMLRWSGLIIDRLMHGGELSEELQEKLILLKSFIPPLKTRV